MPLESSITKSIVKMAKSQGWWTLKIAGGPFQRAGIPDLLCIKKGRAVFLEVKQPGKNPTPLQKVVIEEIRDQAGAVAEVVRSKEEAERVLNGLHHIEPDNAVEACAVRVHARPSRRKVDKETCPNGEANG